MHFIFAAIITYARQSNHNRRARSDAEPLSGATRGYPSHRLRPRPQASRGRLVSLPPLLLLLLPSLPMTKIVSWCR
jgi:hypothetical protein